MRHLLPTAALILLPVTGQADISVQFIEGAPKDQFIITATACDVANAEIQIDLSTAPAGLIFDVTASGAGVEVFQPVELVSGSAAIAQVTDGDQVLGLNIPTLNSQNPVTISADIDDTLTNGQSGQIIVRGSEIAGASVVATLDGETLRGAFDTSGQALVRTPGCVS